MLGPNIFNVRTDVQHKSSSMAAYRANILIVIHDNYEKCFLINCTAAISMQSADSMTKMH